MSLFSEFQTGLLLAKRARFLTTSLWLLLTVLGLALLASQFSGRQSATVALDVGISSIRLLLPFLIIILTQELLSREFDRRYYLTTLTYPRPRHRLLIGRLSTILLLVYALLIVMALSLGWLAAHIGSGMEQTTPISLGSHYLSTIGFIAVDLFVLTTIACLLAIAATTPSFIFIGTLGFMLIARSYSNIVQLLERKRFLVDNTEQYQGSLNTLSYLLPDLARLDIRAIALYGDMALLPSDWLATLISCMFYGVMLIAISLLVLHRKHFN